MRVSCVYALAREYVSVYAHTCQCVGRGVCQCVLYDVCLVCVYSVSVRRVPVCVCQCVSMCVSVCVVVCVWKGRGGYGPCLHRHFVHTDYTRVYFTGLYTYAFHLQSLTLVRSIRTLLSAYFSFL